MNVYRHELRIMLDGLHVMRSAVLRRSIREEFLYSTDLPQVADSETVRQFIDTARSGGWRAETENGWIHLDPTRIHEWPDMDPKIPDNPESRCCLSILRRHHNDVKPSDGSIERRLIKAAEESPQSYAKVCAQIHAEWAAALREHLRIPDIDHRFLGG